MKVYEDDLVAVAQSVECVIPGYLVVRLKPAGSTLGELGLRDAERLGAMLSRSARAIGSIVGAERVYCLSFCEVDPQLHFHLFPRTGWLLAAYHAGTGTRGQPVDGPALFGWARRAFPAGAALPRAAAPDLETACSRLRAALAG